ncbi:MAG: hypothetical protein B0W54_21305 [Cellvibrio sp. 79]|nr:MAG: hypothetical protein B0W54_21305 [Cellvibrio sp. 79]
MNIGQAAQASGLSTKAIRYYEDLGLVVPERDQSNDYRVYSSRNVEHLRFLCRARAVGLNLEECSNLLAIYSDPERRCAQVKALVAEKIALVDQQLSSLAALRETLAGMANECTGNTADEISPERIHGAQIGKPAGMAFTLVGESDTP